MMVPVGRLTIVRTFSKSDLVRAMSFVSIPALLAPCWTNRGGLIVGYLHWRVIFFVNIRLGFWVCHGLPASSDYHEEHRNPLDVGGLICLGLHCAAFLCAGGFWEHTLTARKCWLAWRLQPFFWRATVCTRREPGFPCWRLTLFRIRTFRSAVNGNFLTALALAGIPFLFPLLYQVGSALLHSVRPADDAAGHRSDEPEDDDTRNSGEGWIPGVLISNTLLIGLLIFVFSSIGMSTLFG